MSPTDVQITFIASMMCMAGMTKVDGCKLRLFVNG